MTLAFVALGLDHRHIYGMTEHMLAQGAHCLGYWADGAPQPLAGYCLLYTSPSPRDQRGSRMPSSA